MIQSTQHLPDARIQREEITPSGKNFSTKKAKQRHVTKFFTGESMQGPEITSHLKKHQVTMHSLEHFWTNDVK
jgi:hypothetical protein